jgi:hypothetical protein
VWMEEMSSWKRASLSGLSDVLIAQPVIIPPCSHLAMKGNNVVKRLPWYCCPNYHRTSLLSYFTLVTSQHERWQLIWSYHVSPVVWYPGSIIVYASEHYFQQSEAKQLQQSLLSMFPEAHVKRIFVETCSSGFRNIQFCCHPCCSRHVIS